MKWNTKETTYYDQGSKPYFNGDEIPESVLLAMGEETANEFLKKGWLADGKKDLDDAKKALQEERDLLFAEAEDLGLKPRNNIGLEKLKIMIEDHNALVILKEEALALGIDPSDDVKFAELKTLVDDAKKALQEDAE